MIKAAELFDPSIGRFWHWAWEYWIEPAFKGITSRKSHIARSKKTVSVCYSLHDPKFNNLEDDNQTKEDSIPGDNEELTLTKISINELIKLAKKRMDECKINVKSQKMFILYEVLGCSAREVGRILGGVGISQNVHGISKRIVKKINWEQMKEDTDIEIPEKQRCVRGDVLASSPVDLGGISRRHFIR